MNNKVRKDFILNGDLYRVIIVLSFPIIINNLIQTLYNVADGIWVSKLGSVQFAATSFVWPVNFLFISIGIGLSIAGTSILAQLIGAGEEKKANKYVSQLVVISLLCSVTFSIIGFIISPFIIDIMGATGELAYYSNIYLKITFLEIPFLFLFFNFNSVLNAEGNTLLPTILSGISAIINVILDPILIFNFNMGIAGAAIATIISKILLALVGLFILFRGNRSIKLDFKNFKIDKNILKEIMNVAVPSSLGQSGSALGFMVLNSFIAFYGTSTIAAFAMVNRITSLVMQPAMGIGAALTAIVGQNLGSNKMNRAKEAFIKSIKFVVLISIVGVFLILWKDRAIINFFMQSKDDMEVINQGIVYLKYILASMPLMGIFSVLQGVFQGSGHTKYSMYMEIGRLWFVRLPMILLFKYFTDIGSSGIWFSMSFSNLIICIYGFIIYRRGKWERKIIKLDNKKEELYNNDEGNRSICEEGE
ncbi:MATE family efflux transporter [Clostridium fallax]|uniref:Probable multidrug resistance protein NorM n=1 Tax=Clostridium fallax TaxID=1533 RepID=A0A1M4VJM5_9CLOT|nr:MATE family efflux transporter [Clostridium fallax]SHE69047.1 putative efflux protein, MATE family [Clostridium fallax]SQB22752.1 MATE efflux family protein [Clostridium fallax]